MPLVNTDPSGIGGFLCSGFYGAGDQPPGRAGECSVGGERAGGVIAALF